jgi:hypothetical protein
VRIWSPLAVGVYALLFAFAIAIKAWVGASSSILHPSSF